MRREGHRNLISLEFDQGKRLLPRPAKVGEQGLRVDLGVANRRGRRFGARFRRHAERASHSTALTSPQVSYGPPFLRVHAIANLLGNRRKLL